MKKPKTAPAESPRFLLWLGQGLALLLFLLVALAPLVDNGTAPSSGPARAWALFARDATLRRTALASAVGLVVTARVFFRGSAATPTLPARTPRQPPPSPVVGA